MSQLLELIKEEPFKFVIPNPGKCFKSRISKRDKVLLLVLNKGYIEAESLDVCYYVTAFLDSHKNSFFIPIGNIEKVRLSRTKKVVYRQRIYFKSFATLLKVLKELKASIIIDKSFEVTTNTLMNVINDLPILERYARDVKTDVNTWLTNVCKILIYESCKKLNMTDMINLTSSVYQVPKGTGGYLNRAPLLCGSYSVINHTSSVFRVEDLTNETLYDNSIFDKKITGDVKTLLDYGYTDFNIKKDIKRGVFKF